MLCFWKGTALPLEEQAESRRQWSALAVKALVILNVFSRFYFTNVSLIRINLPITG